MVSIIAPAVDGRAVTPSNSTVITLTRGLYIGDGGDVAVTWQNGGSSVFVDVPTGTILPIQVKQVLSTGTNAQSIVALY